MKYPIIEIHSKKIITDEERSSIEEYWSYKYIYAGINLNEIKLKFIRSEIEFEFSFESTYAIINYGECSDCKSENKIHIKNKTEGRQKIMNYYYYYFCEDCREFMNNKLKKLSTTDAVKLQLDYAYHHKLWEKLDNDELTFLKAVNYLKTWSRVYWEIIEPNANYGWEVFNKLVKINLIYYYDNIVTKQKQIYILPELHKYLLENKNLKNL